MQICPEDYSTVVEMLARCQSRLKLKKPILANRENSIPIVRAATKILIRKPPSHPHHELWVTCAKSCVQGGFDYFSDQLKSSLKDHFDVFKGCKLHSIWEMKPTATSFDNFFDFLPFLDVS